MPKDIKIQHIDVSEIIKELQKGLNVPIVDMFLLYDNDIVIKNNDLEIYSGEPKATVNIMRMINTSNNLHVEDSTYGGNFSDFTGQKISSVLIMSLIDRIKTVLEQYNGYNWNNAESSEIVSAIEQVDAYVSEKDPRMLIINVIIRFESGKTTNLVFTLGANS